MSIRYQQSHITERFAKLDPQTVAEAARTCAVAQAPLPHSSNTWLSRNLPTHKQTWQKWPQKNVILKLRHRVRVFFFKNEKCRLQRA